MRLRCWSESAARPSGYAPEIKLERYAGKKERDKDNDRVAYEELESRRAAAALKQRDEARGLPGVWGGGAGAPDFDAYGARACGPQLLRPLDLDPCDPKLMMSFVSVSQLEHCYMPPLPGIDSLGRPVDRAEVEFAQETILRFFEEAGCPGPKLFGLWASHPILAYLEGRTKATTRAPLVLLAEVALNDAIIPMINTVVVLKTELQVALERVVGIVHFLVTLADAPAYKRVPAVKAMLHVIIAFADTMHQCELEQNLALHLQEPEYAPATKATLLSEVKKQISELCLQLSTTLLELQLQLRVSETAAPVAVESKSGAKAEGSGGGGLLGAEPRSQADRAGANSAATALQFFEYAKNGPPKRRNMMQRFLRLR